jgi:hypothetical protein
MCTPQAIQSAPIKVSAPYTLDLAARCVNRLPLLHAIRNPAVRRDSTSTRR